MQINFLRESHVKCVTTNHFTPLHEFVLFSKIINHKIEELFDTNKMTLQPHKRQHKPCSTSPPRCEKHAPKGFFPSTLISLASKFPLGIFNFNVMY